MSLEAAEMSVFVNVSSAKLLELTAGQFTYLFNEYCFNFEYEEPGHQNWVALWQI